MDVSDPAPTWESLTRQVTETARDAARDGAAIAVGLGILGVNRLQSIRRDLEHRFGDLVTPRGGDDRDMPDDDRG